jgi:5-methylcytosine-specific restriction protein A
MASFSTPEKTSAETCSSCGGIWPSDHAANGKDLHLFEYVKGDTKGFVRYIGQVVCTGNGFREAADTTGAKRKAIVFELTPLQEFVSDTDSVAPGKDTESKSLEEDSLAELRSKAIGASAAGRDSSERRALVRLRSRAIKLYVLKRSGGKCEGCKTPAPFRTPQAQPYLEPHHIRRLSDGGPDDPRWVIAICPNCHRRAHYSEDAQSYNNLLSQTVSQIEKAGPGASEA